MKHISEVILEFMKDNTEYWNAVCERDADWEAFCKNPSENNWNLYAEASKRVGSFEPTPKEEA